MARLRTLGPGRHPHLYLLLLATLIALVLLLLSGDRTVLSVLA